MRIAPDERVCLEARQHSIVLVWPFAKALVLALIGMLLVLESWPLSVGGAVALSLVAVFVLRPLWRWERTRFVVTTQKLFVVHGTLRRRAAGVPLARLGPVEVTQTVTGRLLGYGTIAAGELEIPYVPEPKRVSGLLHRLAAQP
jgi:membrane protein YdbS with pleckstrin-like domain